MSKGIKKLTQKKLTIGLPRMHAESGEKRDFLPDFVARLTKAGADVYIEKGYGSRMGISEKAYQQAAPDIHVTTHQNVFEQEIVLVLRCPSEEEILLMKRGSVLVSMLHYPTRKVRTEMIHSMGIKAVSLDSIKDDSGRRLVENLSSVAWNGLDIAFEVLQQTYPEPGFSSPTRGPIQVTLLGSGAVAKHVMQAAIRYGDIERWKSLASSGVPGVKVTVVDYDLSGKIQFMKEILTCTDILVDATQRPDPGVPVIENQWIGSMPEHAVLVDLSVDPYFCDHNPTSVKGIEGIPHGNLDQYIFRPDDPAFDLIPDCIDTSNRRHSVSCYSWPGIHPKACMEVYGTQIRPIMRVLIEKGGTKKIRAHGKFFERAIHRATLSTWMANNQ